jgi:hypothetical protein
MLEYLALKRSKFYHTIPYHTIHAEDCFAELGVTVNDSDIDRVHRVGRGGLSPPQMIVKFTSYRAKERVVKNRSKLTGKKGIYVNEDLTSYNLDLPRKAGMAGHVLHTWASDGKFFVKLEDESIHVVSCPDDILALQPEICMIDSLSVTCYFQR